MPIYDSNGNSISSVRKRKPAMTEYGSTGRSLSSMYQQYLSTDEYLNDLIFPNDVKIYEKMARSDGQVWAILLMISLPIRATQWFIKPKDKSQKAVEIANFIQDSLFGGYGIGIQSGYDEFIKNITTMFQFGFSVFEKVFHIKDGFLKWKKFAVRPQSTFSDFYYDRAGDCTGIQQYNILDNWNYVDIPIEKLLMFSHEMQQGDIRGRSVLRTAYKHWSIKDFLYKIVNVGIERNFVGTPVLKLPENYTERDKEIADEVVVTIRSNQFGGITIPENFELDMFEGKRTLMEVQPYIDHHNMEISKCILSQFMNLGTTGNGGSFALSSDMSQLFMMMLDASAKNICNIINTHAIPELVNYNYLSDLYPTLAFKPINSTKIINTLKTLVDGKIVLPDDDLEGFIRDMLDFPDANPVQSRKEVVDQFKQNKEIEMQNSEKDTNEDGIKIKNKKNPNDTKSKTPIDNKSKQKEYTDKIKTDNTDKKLSENIINEVLSNLNEKSRGNLFDVLKKQAVALNEKADTTAIEDLSTIKVKYKGELSQVICNILKNDIKLNEDIKFKARINILSNNISESLKSNFLNEYFKEKGLSIDKIVENVINSL